MGLVLLLLLLLLLELEKTPSLVHHYNIMHRSSFIIIIIIIFIIILYVVQVSYYELYLRGRSKNSQKIRSVCPYDVILWFFITPIMTANPKLEHYLYDFNIN
jgi:flagellar basal body-associated protein FliL